MIGLFFFAKCAQNIECCHVIVFVVVVGVAGEVDVALSVVVTIMVLPIVVDIVRVFLVIVVGVVFQVPQRRARLFATIPSYSESFSTDLALASVIFTNNVFTTLELSVSLVLLFLIWHLELLLQFKQSWCRSY